MWHHCPNAKRATDNNWVTQFSCAIGLGNEMKIKSRLLPLFFSFVFGVNMHFVFSLTYFRLQVNASICFTVWLCLSDHSKFHFCDCVLCWFSRKYQWSCSLPRCAVSVWYRDWIGFKIIIITVWYRDWIGFKIIIIIIHWKRRHSKYYSRIGRRGEIWGGKYLVVWKLWFSVYDCLDNDTKVSQVAKWHHCDIWLNSYCQWYALMHDGCRLWMGCFSLHSLMPTHSDIHCSDIPLGWINCYCFCYPVMTLLFVAKEASPVCGAIHTASKANNQVLFCCCCCCCFFSFVINTIHSM